MLVPTKVSSVGDGRTVATLEAGEGREIRVDELRVRARPRASAVADDEVVGEAEEV